ncbi:hypothetical protein, partial [Holdemanella porci]|uniref:hypothetical protein n=1 Tax=Holdemanella porci TaxID=2652276 RepID=UPI003AB6FEA4
CITLSTNCEQIYRFLRLFVPSQKAIEESLYQQESNRLLKAILNNLLPNIHLQNSYLLQSKWYTKRT